MFYATHSEAQTRLLHAYATEHGLLATGSTDFHGPGHERFDHFRGFELYGLSRISAHRRSLNVVTERQRFNGRRSSGYKDPAGIASPARPPARARRRHARTRRSWPASSAGAYIAFGGLLAISVSSGLDPKTWGTLPTLFTGATSSRSA